MTIYKYKLKEHGKNYITIPENAQILCVKVQDSYPVLWVLIDETYEKFDIRQFRVYATGETIDIPKQELNYIGTVQINVGSSFFSEFVGHIFEITENHDKDSK